MPHVQVKLGRVSPGTRENIRSYIKFNGGGYINKKEQVKHCDGLG